MNNYKLGSLFDGSGGFPLAGSLCGIEPVWAAEVEPYPIAVTRSRFPNMKHLGDISKVNGAEIEPVDIITFGSPCQDLSVAGKRAGLKHTDNGDEETTRSGLFMEAVRIIKEMRKATNGNYPRFAIWENVPGAFSSNNGEDFRIVCEELIKIVEPSAFMPSVPKNGWNYADSFVGDGWSLAYRVFDAQYWGVPQRRRRIYLVADFRGECAREVLFEREGLQGYFETGRTPWQATPAHAEGSLGADDQDGESLGGDGTRGGRQLDAVGVINAIGGNAESGQETDTFPTLTNGTAPGFQNAVAVPIDPTFIIDNVGGQAEYAKASEVNGTLRAGAQGLVAYAVENHPADSRVNIDESGKVQTLTSRMGTGGGNVPMVMEQTPFCKSGRARSADDATTWKEGKVANTLNTFDQGETRANELVVAFAQNQRDEVRDLGDKAGAVQAQPGMKQQTFIAEPVVPIHDQATRFSGKRGDKADGKGNGLGVGEPGDPMNTLTSGDRHAVAFAEPTTVEGEKIAGTLMARDYKGLGRWDTVSHIVCSNYIVRRLTPTECARLQGFADRWGWIEEKKALTEEEFRFWLEVRNTHARINGKKEQEYTAKQMLTWYNKLWTDSSEYKMWGNGIALPTALYCVQGMAEVLARPVVIEDDDDWMN